LFYFIELFNNVVTFRKLDSQIRLPTFDFGQNGDIYFEFKTTIENAIIFESHGPKDYIKLSLISNKIIICLLLCKKKLLLPNLNIYCCFDH